MKLYYIDTVERQIRKIEVDSATESTVFIDGRRRKRYSTWQWYGETKQEVKDKLVGLFESEARLAEREFNYRRQRLAEARELSVD